MIEPALSAPSAIVMGSKPGGVVALSVLLRRGWDVRAVVTSPAYDHGPVLIERAERHGVAVYDDQAKLPAELGVDFVLSYMYRRLVRPSTLARASRAALNFHAGPLPGFGGWAFYNVAILEGAVEYGCTCHHMDEGFDSGPLLEVRRFPIDAGRETAVSLERKTQREMVRLFVDFCRLAESGRPLPNHAQDPARARYLTRAEFDALKEIPMGADEETIQRYARAFWFPPYRGAYLRFGAHEVEVVPDAAKESLHALLHRDDLSDLEQVAAAQTASGR